MQSKYWLLLGAIILVGGVSFINRNNEIPPASDVTANVSVTNGQQIIPLEAKGGYSPSMTIATAGMPSILRVTTAGTFDCSSAISIPSLGYRANLPPSGTTDVEIPAQPAGTTLNGTCSMGMYHFAIAFK